VPHDHRSLIAVIVGLLSFFIPKPLEYCGVEQNSAVYHQPQDTELVEM
jgi:hypothetical protein